MKIPSLKKSRLSIVLLTVTLAMTFSHQALAESTSTSFKKPLEIQKIMLKMGMEMHNISDAISAEDWPIIEKSADFIANHPKPPMTERMKIMRFLGTEAIQFKANDKKTHKAAGALAYAAAQKESSTVNKAFGVLQQTCLACHQAYRAKLQDYFYGQH